jgi:hypothetical protein
MPESIDWPPPHPPQPRRRRRFLLILAVLAGIVFGGRTALWPTPPTPQTLAGARTACGRFVGCIIQLRLCEAPV